MKKIKKLIGEGKILQAIEEALEAIEFQNYGNELWVIRGTYAKNELDKDQGVLDRKEYEITRNKTAVSLMNLIKRIESEKSTIVIEPKFSKDSKKKFQVLKDPISPGDRTKGENTRVESISWSIDGVFILTQCLNFKWFKIWHVDDRKCVAKVQSDGILRNVQFYKYDGSIWGIEDNCKIVVWKKIPSETNDYGVEWTRERVIRISENNFQKPYIKEALYRVNFGMRKTTFISVFEEGEDKFGSVLFWTEYSNGPEKMPNYFEDLDDTRYYRPRLKHIDFLNGYLAIISNNDKITIKHRDKKDKEIPGSDIAMGESIACDVYVTSSNQDGYLPISMWNAETDKPKTFEFKHHWNSYDELVSHSNSFSNIQVYRNYPYRFAVLATHSYQGELYYLEFIFDKEHKIDDIRTTKLEGHSKTITKIDLKGPGVSTSSEDGTIRIWNPRNEKRKFEIGCITNCHPILNPFEWDPESKSKLAYADVHGLVHIVNFTYDVFKEDKSRGDSLVKRYISIKQAINWLLFIHLCAFIYFLFNRNNEIGLFNRLAFAFSKPLKETLRGTFFGEDNALIPYFLGLAILFYIKSTTYKEIEKEYPNRLKKNNIHDGDI